MLQARRLASLICSRKYCSSARDFKSKSKSLNFRELKFESKVPVEPVAPPVSVESAEKFQIDKSTLELLERLSLVNLSDK